MRAALDFSSNSKSRAWLRLHSLTLVVARVTSMSRHSFSGLKKWLDLPCSAKWLHNSSLSASMRLIKSYSSDSAKIVDQFSQVPRKSWCRPQSLNQKKTSKESQRAPLLCWAWNWETICGRTRMARAAWWACQPLASRATESPLRICLSWLKKKRSLTMHTFKFRSLKMAKSRQKVRVRMITWCRLFKCSCPMKFRMLCAWWTSSNTQVWTLIHDLMTSEFKLFLQK